MLLMAWTFRRRTDLDVKQALWRCSTKSRVCAEIDVKLVMLANSALVEPYAAKSQNMLWYIAKTVFSIETALVEVLLLITLHPQPVGVWDTIAITVVASLVMVAVAANVQYILALYMALSAIQLQVA